MVKENIFILMVIITKDNGKIIIWVDKENLLIHKDVYCMMVIGKMINIMDMVQNTLIMMEI